MGSIFTQEDLAAIYDAKERDRDRMLAAAAQSAGIDEPPATILDVAQAVEALQKLGWEYVGHEQWRNSSRQLKMRHPDGWIAFYPSPHGP